MSSSSSSSNKKRKNADAAAVVNGSDICLQLLEPCGAHGVSQHVDRSEELLKEGDYAGAIVEAGSVLDSLPSLPDIARAARARGRVLAKQADEESQTTGKQAPIEVFEKAWSAFQLSHKLNPDCQESKAEFDRMSNFLRRVSLHQRAKRLEVAATAPDFDVLVVGAGAAGIGMAHMLTQTFRLDPNRILVVEQGGAIGESFRRWPKEMRFLTPSFNQQGWTSSFDLNSIAHGTSPAYSLHSEHPTGSEYAAYLFAIARTNKLQVMLRTKVVSVTPVGAASGEGKLPLFSVDVRNLNDDDATATGAGSVASGDNEAISAHFVVWAAGEYQYPRVPSPSNNKTTMMEEEKKYGELTKNNGESAEDDDNDDERLLGSELCLHNSRVQSWSKVPGDDFVVIGGYESGLDAAINLAKSGKRCTVLASTPFWSAKTPDPSAELSPYTAGRLREVTSENFSPRPRLLGPMRVLRVEKSADGKGGFDVTAKWKAAEEDPHAPLRQPVLNDGDLQRQPAGEEGSVFVLHTPNPPILCTGFEGSAATSSLFEFPDDTHPHKGCLGDAPLLTKNDESTRVPGVFLAGPAVQHDKLVFCFVYKFRQRFAVVANAICTRLGINTKAAVAECRKNNMYLDDFETCEDTCGDVC